MLANRVHTFSGYCANALAAFSLRLKYDEQEDRLSATGLRALTPLQINLRGETNIGCLITGSWNTPVNRFTPGGGEEGGDGGD